MRIPDPELHRSAGRRLDRGPGSVSRMYGRVHDRAGRHRPAVELAPEFSEASRNPVLIDHTSPAPATQKSRVAGAVPFMVPEAAPAAAWAVTAMT